ncbi:MAG: hypothetical protein Q7T71_16315 [Herbiconiux sp.]|nr:hypothetical protein [Herbiconiux sp.]
MRTARLALGWATIALVLLIAGVLSYLFIGALLGLSLAGFEQGGPLPTWITGIGVPLAIGVGLGWPALWWFGRMPRHLDDLDRRDDLDGRDPDREA